jgi:DNA-binding MarR family transcriptional regulator
MDGLMKYMNRIARCSNFYRTSQLRDTGISGVQCAYLLRISCQPGISQDQLAGQLYKDKSVVARQIATLQQQGFIRREPSQSDRRVQQLYPTDQTLEALPQILEVFQRWDEVLTRGFSGEEREQALRLLERMYENAEAELHRPDAEEQP